MAGKRFGQVTQLPSGKYRARYRRDGIWTNAPMTFREKADADAWLATEYADLVREVHRAPRRVRDTVGGYGDRWIAQHRKLKASTRAEYAYSWEHYVTPYLGKLRLDKLTPEMVRSWQAELSDDIRERLGEQKPKRSATVRNGSATVDRAYRLLRTVMNAAVRDRILQASPCTLEGAGRSATSERPTLSVQELDELTKEVPQHYAALVQLLAWSGLRVGEAAALQRQDLDLDPERPTVTVRERAYLVEGKLDLDSPKSSKSARIVALPSQLVPVLLQHMDTYTQQEPHALVFTSATGKNILFSYSQPISRALNRIGRKDVRVHDLRHTGNTLAAMSGAALPELMHRMGHSTTEAAAVYLHTQADHGRAVADRMAELATVPDNVTPIRKRRTA